MWYDAPDVIALRVLTRSDCGGAWPAQAGSRGSSCRPCGLTRVGSSGTLSLPPTRRSFGCPAVAVGAAPRPQVTRISTPAAPFPIAVIRLHEWRVNIVRLAGSRGLHPRPGRAEPSTRMDRSRPIAALRCLAEHAGGKGVLMQNDLAASWRRRKREAMRYLGHCWLVAAGGGHVGTSRRR
jgi:hypothetical protein